MPIHLILILSKPLSTIGMQGPVHGNYIKLKLLSLRCSDEFDVAREGELPQSVNTSLKASHMQNINTPTLITP